MVAKGMLVSFDMITLLDSLKLSGQAIGAVTSSGTTMWSSAGQIYRSIGDILTPILQLRSNDFQRGKGIRRLMLLRLIT